MIGCDFLPGGWQGLIQAHRHWRCQAFSFVESDLKSVIARDALPDPARSFAKSRLFPRILNGPAQLCCARPFRRACARPAPDNTGGIIALVSAHRHTDDWHAEAERRNDGAVATMRNHEISMWEGQQVRTTQLGSHVRRKSEYLISHRWPKRHQSAYGQAGEDGNDAPLRRLFCMQISARSIIVISTVYHPCDTLRPVARATYGAENRCVAARYRHPAILSQSW